MIEAADTASTSTATTTAAVAPGEMVTCKLELLSMPAVALAEAPQVCVDATASKLAENDALCALSGDALGVIGSVSLCDLVEALLGDPLGT